MPTSSGHEYCISYGQGGPPESESTCQQAYLLTGLVGRPGAQLLLDALYLAQVPAAADLS
jgi:hypothetical protein